VLTDEIRTIVNEAMDALPEDLRTAIVLRELEGLSYEEIAASMDCPVGTVRSRIFRAREAIDRRLREVFEGGLGALRVGMNEELDSQLSAMFDDELPSGECELLARRLSRDAALQARWGRYAAIGAAVRGDVRVGSRVAQKVSVAIIAEAQLASTPLPRARRGASTAALLWRGLAGAAVAASVAALSILWLQGGIRAARERWSRAPRRPPRLRWKRARATSCRDRPSSA